MRLLCPSIANDIQVKLLKSTIAQVSLFDGCSDQFIVAMTSLLEMVAVPAQTTLFSAGDYGDAMYVVHSGVLSTICNSVTVRELRKGSCFGEISVFSSLSRTATVVSTSYATLYKPSRFHCERVLEGYPERAALRRLSHCFILCYLVIHSSGTRSYSMPIRMLGSDWLHVCGSHNTI